MKTNYLLIVLILCVSISCKKEKKRICNVYDGDVDYAIGTITKLNSAPFKATYNYTYTVKGISYSGKEKAYGIGQDESRLIGKSYIVVYETSDAGQSDLNFDYPVDNSDSTKFKQFINDFANNPPKADWPKCK
ncbi:MAG: hypothetical protein KF900_00380 [Bacteroidetes bacterium]|nr:hypothetical protein [Bacteroidota bacterium]